MFLGSTSPSGETPSRIMNCLDWTLINEILRCYSLAERLTRQPGDFTIMERNEWAWGKNKNHQDFYKPQCYNELPQGLKYPATFHLWFIIRCMPYPAFSSNFIIQPDSQHWGCLSWNSLGIYTVKSVVVLEGDETVKPRMGISSALVRKLAPLSWLFSFPLCAAAAKRHGEQQWWEDLICA